MVDTWIVDGRFVGFTRRVYTLNVCGSSVGEISTPRPRCLARTLFRNHYGDRVRTFFKPSADPLAMSASTGLAVDTGSWTAAAAAAESKATLAATAAVAADTMAAANTVAVTAVAVVVIDAVSRRRRPYMEDVWYGVNGWCRRANAGRVCRRRKSQRTRQRLVADVFFARALQRSLCDAPGRRAISYRRIRTEPGGGDLGRAGGGGPSNGRENRPTAAAAAVRVFSVSPYHLGNIVRSILFAFPLPPPSKSVFILHAQSVHIRITE